VTKLVEAIEEAERLAKASGKRTRKGGGGISPKERWYQLVAYLAQVLDAFSRISTWKASSRRWIRWRRFWMSFRGRLRRLDDKLERSKPFEAEPRNGPRTRLNSVSCI